MGDDPTIEGAIGQFVAYLKATQSRRTARTYRTALNHFARYLAAQEPPVTRLEQMTPQAASNFPTWLYDYFLERAGGDPNRVKATTRHNYLAAFARFAEWLVVETGRLPWTVGQYDVLRVALRRAGKVASGDHLPPDKLPSLEIVAALVAEARKPLDLPPDTAPGDAARRELAWLRNIAIVETLRSSGLRVGELVGLERGDLLHEQHGAYVRHGKGGKERTALLSGEAWGAVTTYLEARGDVGSGRQLARLPVFARHARAAGARTLPLGVRGVQGAIESLARSAGILERFNLTPHTLRHFFATEFLSETGDLALTQYALGHASPTTTRIYAQTKHQDYQRAHAKVFDR